MANVVEEDYWELDHDLLDVGKVELLFFLETAEQTHLGLLGDNCGY